MTSSDFSSVSRERLAQLKKGVFENGKFRSCRLSIFVKPSVNFCVFPMIPSRYPPSIIGGRSLHSVKTHISENNIISVEPAKVLRYTLNFHPQKVGFRVILSLPWPHAIHLMGVGSPFSFLGSVQMGNPNAQGTSLVICT